MYTHDFKLEFDGLIIEGEIEFNDDGVASYKFSDTYNFTIEQTDNLTRLMSLWHNIYKAFGETIKLIRLKEKVI